MLNPKNNLHGYTVRDLHACAEREAIMRRRVYPGLIARGKMDPFAADAEITKMEIIAEHFASLVEVVPSDVMEKEK